MSGIFYRLGRAIGPRVRKGKWIWNTLAGSARDEIRSEEAVGRDLAREIAAGMEPDGGAGGQDLLDAIGPRLVERVRDRRRSFTFTAVRAPAPNAFALPGGFLFVTRPLLDLCGGGRDEIAFVLGHEMAHVIRRHALDRLLQASAVSLVTARAAPGHGALGHWIRGAGTKLLTSAYSRDDELEADALGMRLAAAAGFDRGAPLRLLARLRDDARRRGAPQLPEYFSSHPPIDARLRNLLRLVHP